MVMGSGFALKNWAKRRSPSRSAPSARTRAVISVSAVITHGSPSTVMRSALARTTRSSPAFVRNRHSRSRTVPPARSVSSPRWRTPSSIQKPIAGIGRPMTSARVHPVTRRKASFTSRSRPLSRPETARIVGLSSNAARSRAAVPRSVIDRVYRATLPRTGGTMPTMKTLALAALVASALATAPPAVAQTTTLTMSSWVSLQHHLTSVVLQGWANEVEKATNGRVKFTMLPKHPSAPPGTFDAVRDGLVDLSYVTASYTPARHILPLMPELPGAGDTALVNSVAYSRIYWKHFHKVGEYKGVKLLGVFTHGPGQMFTKKLVNGIADVQGLKIRTGGGIAEKVAKALGASAFVKPAPESYELLSSGVADGVFFPLESIISFT